MDIKVSSTWGYGPDLMMSSKSVSVLNDSPSEDMDKFMYGVQKNWSLDLTRDDAIDLIGKLKMAIKHWNELEDLCKDHDEECERRGLEPGERF